MGNSGSSGNTGAAVACNGNAALCSRLYSDVVQVGTHDSAFVGYLPTQNQEVSVSGQLNAGIRFLQAQTHLNNGVLTLCHTTCLEENAGPLTDYLTTIKTWMDANDGQVVTLLLTNGDNEPVSMFGDAMSSTGLASYAYTPPSVLAMSEWPTLQTLINDGTRLVMFLDYGADTTQVSYINNEFDYFFETAYDVTSFSSCALDRPPGSSGAGLMMLVNHFRDLSVLGILIPDVADTMQTNAATGTNSIGAQADLCETTWGRGPNLVLVDNYNLGDVFTAQNNLNGL